ncbi:MAG: hypothetical protein AAGK00_06065 [Pseudomonadota bacterium]
MQSAAEQSQMRVNMSVPFDEVLDRLGAFGIGPDSVEMDDQGRVVIGIPEMLRVLEIEAHTGFRSPYALGRALDERRRYRDLGILAIRLDLASLCDTHRPEQVDGVLRQLSGTVRELDACYRCIDTTLVMLLPESGSREAIVSAARRVRQALTEMGIEADIGASATIYQEGAQGHEYLGSAFIALVDALNEPDRIAFVEV